jgi:ubiquinone/menaquinone biosynthesis C-methylase UbiE
MLMNRIETWTVNNPLRALLQRRVEAPLLARKGGRLTGGAALELGCGRGEGLRIILEELGAATVVGIDMDPAQVERARRRVGPRYAERVRVQAGDAARLEFDDASFDAVFDFGILHHVPEWRQALVEVRRVLKQGGRFYFEEVLRGFLETPLSRALFEHPEEGHFSAGELVGACREAGLRLVGDVTEVGRWFAFGVAVRA